MQISVHPGAVLAAFVHDDLVRLVPVVLAGPPEACQRSTQLHGRPRLRQAALELGEGHGTLPHAILPPLLRREPPAASSITWPSANNVCSSNGRPMSCSP